MLAFSPIWHEIIIRHVTQSLKFPLQPDHRLSHIFFPISCEWRQKKLALKWTIYCLLISRRRKKRPRQLVGTCVHIFYVFIIFHIFRLTFQRFIVRERVRASEWVREAYLGKDFFLMEHWVMMIIERKSPTNEHEEGGTRQFCKYSHEKKKWVFLYQST
jgi:hypothetical protein